MSKRSRLDGRAEQAWARYVNPAFHAVQKDRPARGSRWDRGAQPVNTKPIAALSGTWTFERKGPNERQEYITWTGQSQRGVDW